MTRPTRQEQAEAILQLKAGRFASKVLGRHARTADDFREAFNLELVDLISAIPTPEVMLGLGANRVGPKDGLYVLDDGGTYRVYTQERGETHYAHRDLDFDRARTAVIEQLVRMNGIPFTPPGM